MRQFRTVWDTNADLIEHEYKEPVEKIYEREEEEYYKERAKEEEDDWRDCRD